MVVVMATVALGVDDADVAGAVFGLIRHGRVAGLHAAGWPGCASWTAARSGRRVAPGRWGWRARPVATGGGNEVGVGPRTARSAKASRAASVYQCSQEAEQAVVKGHTGSGVCCKMPSICPMASAPSSVAGITQPVAACLAS